MVNIAIGQVNLKTGFRRCLKEFFQSGLAIRQMMDALLNNFVHAKQILVMLGAVVTIL